MTRLGHTVLQGHMTCFEHYQLGLFEIHQFVYETIYGGKSLLSKFVKISGTQRILIAKQEWNSMESSSNVS